MTPPALPERGVRLRSLDVFRGGTIAAMILVNNPGSLEHVYPQLRHAQWHGWTMADWIFPFFLWIVGVAMVFSREHRKEQGVSDGTLLRRAAQRAGLLFLLGLFLNGFPFGLFSSEFSWATIRIPGVLQRIAVCYLVAFVILNYSGLRGQLLWTAGLLGGYWVLMACVPAGVFGPGGLDPEGNLAWYIDSSILAGHTWQFAPVAGFDPEGILTTIPAIATTLLGAAAGQWLRLPRPAEQSAGWMFLAGTAMTVAGIILDMSFPINKNLWTSSYVIFTGGWAFLCFAAVFWLVEVHQISQWSKPFVILGTNAIAVYALSEMVWSLMWAVAWEGESASVVYLHDALASVFNPLAGPPTASFLFSFVYTLTMTAVAWALWKKKIFLKL